MKPLSYLQYIKGNHKKVFSLILSIVFSILLIGSIHMFLTNSIDLAKITSKQYDRMTFIDTNGEEIDETIEQHPDIDRVIRVRSNFILFQGMAINSSGEVYIMDRDDVIYIMNLLHIEFDQSKIPENNLNELISDERLLINNEYKIGEEITVHNQKMIVNKGFKSDYLLGFIPTNQEILNDIYIDELIERSNGYLIVPKENKLEEVNLFLKENLRTTYKVYDNEYWDSVVENVTGDVSYLFNIVTIIILISIGIGLGISTYVHYFQRRKEFGVLSSLGYSDRKILLRINQEIIITSIIAFIFSLLLLIIEKYLINTILLIPAGVPIFHLDVKLISRIIVIPLFTSVFSLVPTWILLRKIDSVSIIEGEI